MAIHESECKQETSSTNLQSSVIKWGCMPHTYRPHHYNTLSWEISFSQNKTVYSKNTLLLHWQCSNIFIVHWKHNCKNQRRREVLEGMLTIKYNYYNISACMLLKWLKYLALPSHTRLYKNMHSNTSPCMGLGRLLLSTMEIWISELNAIPCSKS